MSRDGFDQIKFDDIWVEGENTAVKSKIFRLPTGWILLIGDCINISELDLTIESKSSLMSGLSQLNGNFHLFYYSSAEQCFYASNSLWGLIPLYFARIGDEFLFSGSLSLIKNHTGYSELNKKYLFQSIVFNYSLCDDTFWLNISALPVNSSMKLEKDLTYSFDRYFSIEDCFVDDPRSGRSVLNNLSDLFIKDTDSWFPDERFAISFTGGFDGRTLVSVANFLGKDFFTYSFGSLDSTDLLFPKAQSKLLGIDFLDIVLDSDYINSYHRKSFNDIVLNSDGMAGINRAHYNFAAEILSKQTGYIVTGNFGSEILRSLHIHGVVFSKAMFYVFKYAKDHQWIDRIAELPEFKMLTPAEFHHEWQDTISDLTDIVEKNSHLEKNLWLYKYVVENVLRKYFGPEIVMQTKYLVNRTPFLNVSFIKELLKTKYAGAYGPFFTDNPFLRFKGQELYAHIIKKTSLDLFNLPTNKGYTPSDILSINGKLHLMRNFISKKLKKNDLVDADPFSVSAATDSNADFIAACFNGNNFVNTNQILKDLMHTENDRRNRALRVMSLLFFISTGRVDGQS